LPRRLPRATRHPHPLHIRNGRAGKRVFHPCRRVGVAVAWA
jgi:hypothetical protein